MKFSLISATSIFALLSVAMGPVHAGVLNSAPDQANIYDLVRDGNTSSDGGDKTVSRRDPLMSAVAALEATNVGWQEASFTGPVDPSAATTTFPRIPLGAAPGTRPDDDFATPITGAWHWNGWQKNLATGMARIAPLIGSIGSGPSAADKPGSTVFAAQGSWAGFGDGGTAGRMPSSSVAAAFAPSSTSTATITVAGAGNFRPRAGAGFAVVAGNSLQAMPATAEPAPRPTLLAEAAQPTLGYHYAPAPNPATNHNVLAASFSNAVTASGTFAQIAEPVTPAKIQTRAVAATDAATYAKAIDVTQPITGNDSGTHVDGTRTFISASVSANPVKAAALYMASVVSATPAAPIGQTVEAFQVGPTPGVRAQGGPGTTVADPLHGKIMASTGPLNNSLALP